MKHPLNKDFILVVDAKGQRWYKLKKIPGWYKTKKEIILRLKNPEKYNLVNNTSHNWKAMNITQYNKDGTFVKQYESMSEAMRETGINVASINRCCKHLQGTAGGYKWKYTNG
jgi:hypothetical protein